jgi:hypothetical protein
MRSLSVWLTACSCCALVLAGCCGQATTGDGQHGGGGEGGGD